MSSTNLPLTICTVSYNHGHFLRLNERLLRSTNPGVAVNWLVAENSPPDSEDRLSEGEDGFVVVNFKYNPSDVASPSHHHALSLNALLPQVKTRFLLCLDPDFYILRRDWVSDVISYMAEHSVAMLGVPWHPKHYVKWRYFPCSHCVFIDTTLIAKAEINFLPTFGPETDDDFAPRQANTIKRSIVNRICGRICRIAFRKRAASIGHSGDTGNLLRKRFQGREDLKIECLTPLWRPSAAIIESILPDYLCYVPRKAGYFRRAAFVDWRIFDNPPDDWEEFVWNDQPFGFHIRCFPKKDLRNGNSVYVDDIVRRQLELSYPAICDE